jgi:hypothetical protein
MTFYNLVKVATLTTGTGTVSLGSAVPGFITFSQAGVVNGSTVSYAIEDGFNREAGTGVYNSSTGTLTRNVVTSTNSNNPIVLSGNAVVFITPLAADLNSATTATANTLALRDGSGVLTASGFSNGTNSAVLGGNNLTTAGAVPYVSASGVLNQDATALFWDAANNRLGVGTASPAFPFVVSDGSSTVEANAAGGAAFLQSGNSPLIIGSRNTGFELRFRTEGTEGMRLTATTRNLLIGTSTDDGANRLQVSGSTGTVGAIVQNTVSGGTARLTLSSQFANSYTNSYIDYNHGAQALKFVSGRSLLGYLSFFTLDVTSTEQERMRLTNPGNLLIGTTTDSNFKLDVGSSGSAGTFRVYDQASPTGVTKLIVRSGAGQGTTNLTEWQNVSGTLLSSISSNGGFRVGNVVTQGGFFDVLNNANSTVLGLWVRNADSGSSAQAGIALNSFGNSWGIGTGSAAKNSNSLVFELDVTAPSEKMRLTTSAILSLPNAGVYGFSSTTSSGGTLDLSLSRASAGVLQVGDGGSNANGQINAIRSILTDTAASGNVLTVYNSNLSNPGEHIRLGFNDNYRWSLSRNISSGNLTFRYQNVAVSATLNSVMELAESGTLSLYNQTPTTGVTRAVIRAGAGQSTNNLTEWQNASATVLSGVASNGSFFVQNFGGLFNAGGSAGFYVGSNSFAIRTNTTDDRLVVQSTGIVSFGGSTASFPALKRSSTTLEVRLADDSALTAISAGQSTFDGLTVGRGAGSVTDNTAVGLNALQANTTGTQNSAFGRGALFTNSTGNFNTAIGRFSLYSNTSGGGNVALGGGSLYTNTTGSDNTAGGVNALFLNLTGSNNTVFGTSSMYSNSSGLDNAAFGNGCLISNTTGSRNVAVGLEAGYTATAANANTTGSNNVWIGYRSGPASTVQRTNSVAIGYQALVGADNAGVLGTAGMKWSVGGQTVPSATLHVENTSASVTEATKLVVKAATNQSTTPLQDWQNSSGTQLALVSSVGAIRSDNFVTLNSDNWNVNQGNMSFASTRLVAWSNSSTDSYGTKDISLTRASAGVLQVGDGAANANGTVNAKIANFLSADSSATTFTTGIASQRVQFYFDSVVPRSSLLFQNGRFEIYDQTSAITRLFIQATTGNISIGGVNNPSDPNFKLDVASSGSSGTFRVYDQTAPTGVTRAVIRAGAGQSTTNLQEWQNSGGGVITYIANTGDIVSTASIQSPFFLGADNSAAYIVLRGAGGASAFAGLSRGQSQFAVFSDYKIGFLSGTNVNATTTSADTAIARNAAGVLEINNGTAGTYRDLILRRSQHNGVTVSALPAAAAGNAGSIQYVTDANATTIGSTVVGGGANKVMVWSDGAAWKIFAS